MSQWLLQLGLSLFVLPSIQDATDLVKRSEVCTEVLDLDGAVEALEKLLQQFDTHDSFARRELGRLYVLKGRLEDARQTYEDLVAEHRESDHEQGIGDWADLGMLLCMMGKPSEALTALDGLNYPSIDVVRTMAYGLLGDIEQSDFLFKQSLASSNAQVKVRAHFARGRVFEERGKVSEAAQHYLGCLREMNASGFDPVYTQQSCLGLGRLCRLRGQYEELIHWLEQIEKLTRDSAEVPFDLGSAHSMLSHYDKAEMYFAKTLTLNPRHYLARMLYARNFEVQGRYEDSLKHYRLAEELSNQNSDLHDRIGSVLMELDRVEEARKSFERAIELGATSASPHRHLAEIFLNESNVDEAISNLRLGVRVDPLDIASHYRLSQILQKSRDPLLREEADRESEKFRILNPFRGRIGHYRSTMKQSPNHAESRVQLAEIYSAINEYEVAMSLLDKALQIDSDHYPARKARGVLSATLGRSTEAKADIDWAFKAIRSSMDPLEKQPKTPAIEKKLLDYQRELDELNELRARLSGD